MRQLIYECRKPESCMIASGVQAIYDGVVSIIKCGRYITAITAKFGEVVMISLESLWSGEMAVALHATK